jgi:hypothetical protein
MSDGPALPPADECRSVNNALAGVAAAALKMVFVSFNFYKQSISFESFILLDTINCICCIAF